MRYGFVRLIRVPVKDFRRNLSLGGCDRNIGGVLSATGL